MYIYQLGTAFDFPHADLALQDGMLAIGGDLNPQRLLRAYVKGIFPWYEEGQPILWWSPDPRMTLNLSELHVSKSLKKILRDEIFEVRFDTDFKNIINACAGTKRKGTVGTWITLDLIDSYMELHKMGFAHSVGAYRENRLVGGLYGLSVGSIFFGESMFHRENDASKVAFVYLVRFLQQNDFDLIDAQQDTDHLRSLGGKPMKRKDFLKCLETFTLKPSLIGNWNSHNCKREIISFT